MEREKRQRWEDQYIESAIIEHEFDYPERKNLREEHKRVLEHSYPDNESRYKGALSYLGGDFVQFLWISPPESEDGWQFIHPVKTVEEHYSQHPRYPLYAPILFKAAPEEVREQNHLVHRMNEAIKQRNAEEINKIREEANAFRESILKKSAESREKK
jgi:hypothetical protein